MKRRGAGKVGVFLVAFGGWKLVDVFVERCLGDVNGSACRWCLTNTAAGE